MPLVPIVPTFTLQVAFWSMSRVFTLILASSPRLTRLLCLCRCLPLLCYTLVLSFLPFGVGFKLSLASFWVCLRLVSHAPNCFIGTLEPSKMRSNMLFIYPLTKLLEIWWMSKHGSFSSCCHIGVCAIFEEIVQVNERFLPTLEGLWWTIGLLLRRVLLCLTCSLFPFFFGQLFNHSSLWMSDFG